MKLSMIMIKDLGNVNHLLFLFLPVQSTCEMHETACLGHDQGGGLGDFKIADLALQPFCGKFGVFHRKDATKATTRIGFRQIDQRRASHVCQQGAWLTVNVHAAQRVTGGMVGERSIPVRTQIRDAQVIDEILREFINTISDGLGPWQPVGIILEQFHVSMLDHVSA